MNPKRLFGFALALLALAALAGCSGARLAYNSADSVLRWMADDYFELDAAQEEAVKARLASFHAWHRSEELPRYGALFARAGDELAAGLAAPKLQWAWDSVQERYRRMMAHAAPDLAEMLVTLTPAQLAHLKSRFAESNAKYAKKYLDGGEAAQRRRRDQRNLELMREWFGDLSDAQEEQLQSAGAGLPLLYALRLENRQRRQREFLSLLRTYRSAAELEPRLRQWLTDWEAGASPAYLRVSALHRDRYIQMLLALDRGLAPTQRTHAVERLRDYAETFAVLAAEGQPARLAADGGRGR
jgi:hypothetical protein